MGGGIRERLRVGWQWRRVRLAGAGGRRLMKRQALNLFRVSGLAPLDSAEARTRSVRREGVLCRQADRPPLSYVDDEGLQPKRPVR